MSPKKWVVLKAQSWIWTSWKWSVYEKQIQLWLMNDLWKLN